MTMDAVSKGWTAALMAVLLAACGGSNTDSTRPDSPISLQNTPSQQEGNANSSELVFQLASSVTQSIDYRTFNISAAAGSDYLATSGTLSFSADQSRNLSVLVYGDTLVEASEMLGIELTYENGAKSVHQGAIVNDDFPTLSLSNASRLEGDQGSASLTFTVTLDEPTLDPFEVRLRTVTAAAAPGIATAGADYIAIDQTVTIPANTDEITLPVSVLGDLLIEPDELFTVEALNSAGLSLATATGTIQDNDNPTFKPQLAVTLPSASASESNTSETSTITFTASLPSAPGFSYSMDYEVIFNATDSAVSGQDLTPQSGTITFTAAETQKEIDIQVSGDDDLELDETFTLRLFNASGFEFASATGTIVNDDVPDILISSPTQLEGSTGGTSIMGFTIELATPPPGDFRFYYRTRIGTATSDFTSIESTAVDLTPANYSITVQVLIDADTDYEQDEIFFLVVNPSPISGTDDELARGTATIVNDDQPPAFLVNESTLPILEGNDIGSPEIVSIRVSLSSPAESQLTYFYRTFSGTGTDSASSGQDVDASIADFTHTEGLIQINQGAETSTGTIDIALTGDRRIEAEESFVVRLYENEASADNDEDSYKEELDVTISNDDTLTLTLLPETLSVAEGDPALGETRTLTSLNTMVSAGNRPRISVEGAEVEEGFTVSVDIDNVLDTDPDDIELSSDTLAVNIPSGDYTTASAFDIEGIQIGGDDLLENDESVRLRINPATFEQDVINTDTLVAGTNTTLLLTLSNDDTLAIQFDSSGPATDPENNPTQTPQLELLSALAAGYDTSGPGGEPLTIQITLGAGSSASEGDFTNLTQVIDIASLANGNGYSTGDTVPVIVVLDDDLIEPDEMAELILSSVSSLVDTSNGDTQSVYTLTSDDQLTVTFAQSAYSYTEGNIPVAPADQVGFSIEGGILASTPILSFEMAVTNISTSAGDYTLASPLTFTIPAGDYVTASTSNLQLNATQFAAISDNIVEGTETLTIDLEPIDASLADYLAVGATTSTTASLLSTDQLTVQFVTVDYQGLENSPSDFPQLAVTGNSEVDVEINLGVLPDPGQAYPATGVTIEALTIPAQTVATNYGVTLNIPTNADNDVNRVTQLELSSTQGPLVNTVSPFTSEYRILNDDAIRMVNGSGMEACFNGTVRVADCSNDITVDSDYRQQDAYLGQVAPAFTSAGTDDDSSPATWTCTTDNRTGLTWAFEDADPPVTRSFSDATAFAESIGSFCSLSGWRLPTLGELYNLFDFSTANTLLDTTVFDTIKTTSTDYYWSSDSDFSGTPWALSFDQGQLDSTSTSRFLMMVTDDDAAQLQPGSTDPVYACDNLDEQVDPAQTSDHRFSLLEVNDDKTVTDNLTGLTWSTESLDTDDSASGANRNWGIAMAAATAEYAGTSDWRTPTIKEVISLLYYGCDPDGGSLTDLRLPPFFAPLLNSSGTAGLPLMSSTPVAADVGDPLQLWVVTLDPASPGVALTQSNPPSNTVQLQQFRVR